MKITTVQLPSEYDWNYMTKEPKFVWVF